MYESSVVPYQWPRDVKLSDCEFYHTMELPEIGIQTGSWDLRDCIDQYLGEQDFKGKKVIDVGTASGFLSFEMEKRGADVISFDFDGGLVNRQHDVIPYHNFEKFYKKTYDEFMTDLLQGLDRMKNSYWLSHKLLKSKAKVFYGDVYNCPNIFGDVHYAMIGNILRHLQNPLQVLTVFGSMVREKIIVSEASWGTMQDDTETSAMYLVPNTQNKENFGTWWQISPGLLIQFLKVLGFQDFVTTFYNATYRDMNIQHPHYTVVATK